MGRLSLPRLQGRRVRVELRVKVGEAVGALLPPEIESLLRKVLADRFVIDGELVIVGG